AGCGRGQDAASLNDKERADLRRQALDWLRADLEELGRLLKDFLDKNPGRPLPGIARTLRYWLWDGDFAGVRGPEALARLPEVERQQWQKLWDEVADTLARALGKTPPEKKAAPK